MAQGDIQSYQDLLVWQQAMDLAVLCYRLAASFPKSELYGLTSQIRRSSTSIAANIAEGYGRDSSGAFVQFLRIAQGSLKETETHILLSERLEFATRSKTEPILALCETLGKMLRGLIRSIQQR